MWFKLGQWVLKYRVALLAILVISTAIMGYFASKVQLSYDFTRAIPTDNQKYIDYQAFKQRFGEDGNLLVLGLETDKFYEQEIFNAVKDLGKQLRTVNGVENVLSVPEAITLIINDSTEKLVPTRIFADRAITQAEVDSGRQVFENLPFYQGLLYNATTNSYLVAVNVNRELMNSKVRSKVVAGIMEKVKAFEQGTGVQVRASGLPFIRTSVGDLLQKEMQYFLIGSLVLSAITLLIFFRSYSAMAISLVVVIIGVVWSLGVMVLFGYKITLLTALIPPLLVVIGVPNCIYFLNKYHASYRETGEKHHALVTMVGKMGIVTLFCNIAAAIGFAVFAFTKSELLKEFGVVAGINIMMLFFISLVFIPAVLSYLPEPKPAHLRYLDNKLLVRLLERIERWTIHHQKWVYIVTLVITGAAVAGIFRLNSEAFIVDDLPKTERIYQDLKWFEQNFKGVMPLEVMIDTKKKNGVVSSIKTFERIEEFSSYVRENPDMARPLSVLEGLKFAKQAYYEGDSLSYAAPSEFDMPFLAPYLRAKPDTGVKGGAGKLMQGFIDTTKQYTRISISMKDIGSKRLPVLLDSLQAKATEVFDTASYNIQFTGASVTFLEGSRFIINGLKESIVLAFILIALCMLYLFRSFRILVCSLIPNVVPLVITAGVMGWTGVPLKPSTVLVFSVALGIAIDVTIRFLVNYKQELPKFNYKVQPTLIETIHHTGISIIYTSLVLIAGFIIFCFSGFGGTKALGWLTSLTLIVGTITNLVLLPVLLLHFSKHPKERK
ncbi:efflux RND transporter permease subunit [Aridibaculum aurantiacum]|uniref:efflux RND transporter permease subunit n=1 Tax=Aridibaculum aurantiacum TaxID=2810307 RepID=UPI001A9588C2|nr:MMPL family transporter [Aridibaculum aurantiacum]